MKKTYIAGTAQEIQNPDPSKGYTYPGNHGQQLTLAPGFYGFVKKKLIRFGSDY